MRDFAAVQNLVCIANFALNIKANSTYVLLQLVFLRELPLPFRFQELALNMRSATTAKPEDYCIKGDKHQRTANTITGVESWLS